MCSKKKTKKQNIYPLSSSATFNQFDWTCVAYGIHEESEGKQTTMKLEGAHIYHNETKNNQNLTRIKNQFKGTED